MLKNMMVIAWLLISTFTLAEQGKLSGLTEPFLTYETLTLNNPQEVINTLLASDFSLSEKNTIRAQYHLILGQAYYNLTYPLKSLEHAQLALNAVSAENQPWLYYSAQIILALASDSAGHPNQELDGLNMAIKWATNHDDHKLYLQGLFARGSISISTADYVDALQAFQEAYSLANDNPNSLSKAHIAAMVAQVYEYRHEPRLAIPYFEEAVAAHRKYQSNFDLSIALYGLGKANKNIGHLALGKKQLLESMQIAKQVDDIQGVAYALKELADIDVSENNLTEAERKLVEAGDIFLKAENNQMNYNVMLSLVNLAINNNEIERAQRYLEQAKKFLVRADMQLHRMSFDEAQANLFYHQKNYQAAYSALAAAFARYREFQNTSSTELLHRTRSRFEVQLAEHENEVLSQKNVLQQLQLISKKNQNFQLILICVFSLIACLLLVFIIYRNKVYKEKLEKLVTLDELTGLYNRRHTMALLTAKINLHKRHRQHLSLAMIDLDWFKKINDSFGHLIGDKVLQEFANTFSKGLRNTDIIGRIGGEEFLIILDYSSADDSYKVIETLASKLSDIGPNIAQPKIALTISVGIVECTAGDSMETLLTLVDKALYQAKESGRNKIVIAQKNSE